ncbi:hypothetical protein SVIOM74S_01115 [Streptomyces violarus]
MTTNPAERLVDLLDLEQIEVNIFRGRSPQESLQRVFGGQVAGQALVAAGRTTDGDRPVHSLHAYFLRPGIPGVPIVYQVERVRDGRSFTTRRVTAVQQGRTIFNLTASFHKPEEGSFEHQLPPARKVPDPESLPTVTDEIREHLGALPEQLERMARRQPFDIRYVDRLRWATEEVADAEPRSAVWMRAVGPLGDDPLVHTCALTYASDMTLLDAVRIPVEPLWGPSGASTWRHWTTPCGSTARSGPTTGCCTTRSRPSRSAAAVWPGAGSTTVRAGWSCRSCRRGSSASSTDLVMCRSGPLFGAPIAPMPGSGDHGGRRALCQRSPARRSGR